MRVVIYDKHDEWCAYQMVKGVWRDEGGELVPTRQVPHLDNLMREIEREGLGFKYDYGD